MHKSIIIAGSRTPIGKFSGSLSALSAQDLGGFAIAGALEKAGITPDMVDAVLMGQVIQAGCGQVTARQAAAKAGIPMTAHASTINKACLSSLQALRMADLMIQTGDAEIVVAGGMESMTNAPYLVANGRSGFRIGDQTLHDSLFHDGLTCAFDHCAMGYATDSYNGGRISRARQDEFSARSHQLAATAIASGIFAEEITRVQVPSRKGSSVFVETDEGVRAEVTSETLGELRTAFIEGGTITAGNASQISDGASAVVIMSADRARTLGLKGIGEIVSYGQVAGPDTSLLMQPARAITLAAAKANLNVTSFDLYEINEAFAAVVLTSRDELGIDEDRLNVHGGAIALGHPVGMSGARIALTALLELGRRGGGIAAVGLCGGGGQGDAAILRSL